MRQTLRLKTGRWTWVPGIAYIDQRPNNAHDWELSLGAESSFALAGQSVDVGLSYVESLRGTGGLAIAQLGTQFWRGHGYEADLRLAEFYDFGYVLDADQQFNHLEVELGLNADAVRWLGGRPARLALLHSVPQTGLRQVDASAKTWLSLSVNLAPD